MATNDNQKTHPESEEARSLGPSPTGELDRTRDIFRCAPAEVNGNRVPPGSHLELEMDIELPLVIYAGLVGSWEEATFRAPGDLHVVEIPGLVGL
jgi:hypothetical protein